MTTKELLQRAKDSCSMREELPERFTLDSKTKFCIRIGDTIQSPWNPTNLYEISTVEHLKNNGVRFTLRDKDNRRIYMTPASEWYGYNVIKKEN